MEFVSDPPICQNSKMKQRVMRWQEPLIVEQGIDQTRMFEDGYADSPEFSFLVVGDSGSGSPSRIQPSTTTANKWYNTRSLPFMLHTGDVIYLVGSSEFYYENFVKPYREFFGRRRTSQTIAYDQMVFNLPILPRTRQPRLL